MDPAEEHVGEWQLIIERHAFARQFQGAIERILVVTPAVPPLVALPPRSSNDARSG
jgi:hypothetical protein